MDRIFAPWRMEYITSNSDDNETKGTGCIFCDFPKLDDDEKISSFIAARPVCHLECVPIQSWTSYGRAISPHRGLAGIEAG